MNPILKDIFRQPELLTKNYLDYRDQVEKQNIILDSTSPLIVTGMGASFFAGQVFTSLLNKAKVPCVLVETSELLYYGYVPPKAKILVISQSGESVEVKKLVEKLNKNEIIAITSHPKSTLALYSHFILNLNIASDHSVAIATYTLTILMLLILGEYLIKKQDGFVDEEALDFTRTTLDDLLRSDDKIEQAVHFLGKDEFNLITVGRGPSLASAWETALLFKEVSKIPCEAYSGGQLRHGSVESVSDKTLALVFAPEGETQDLSFRLAEELLSYGSKVFIVSGREFSKKGKNLFEFIINHPNEFLAPIIDVVLFQLISYKLAQNRGIKPGDFINTTPVITNE